MQALDVENMYFVHKEQLKSLNEAIDVLTMIYHACQYEEETGKGVAAGVVASAVSLARDAIAGMLGDIEAGGVIAQLSREAGKEAAV